MTIDGSTIIIAVLSVVGGLVWLIRLEGRIDVTDSRYGEILRRLERIENKQDQIGV